MLRLGLTGFPLSHSLSPVIQTAALESCGLEGTYSLFPIQPDDKQGLKQLLDRVRDGEVAGLNVTIPHKQIVLEFLDELTPPAQAIGAVNTIYQRDRKLVGDNTDAPGFMTDLKRFLTSEPRSHRNLSALVLGAGGSARAVVYALLHDDWQVTIAARRMEQALQLVDAFTTDQLPMNVCTLSNLQSLSSSLTLIINTTPVGMTPNLEHSPWPENVPFPPQAAIYDLIYNPRETRLVREARSQGHPASTGLGMLVEQAALAFEIWTDHQPSRETMFASVDQFLISSY